MGVGGVQIGAIARRAACTARGYISAGTANCQDANSAHASAISRVRRCVFGVECYGPFEQL